MCIRDSYGVESIEKLLKSNSHCFFSYSWMLEYGEDVTHVDLKKKKNRVIAWMFSLLQSNFLMNGANGSTIKSKFLLRLTRVHIKYIDPSINIERKDLLLDIVGDYFSDIKQLHTCQFIGELTPRIFFANQVPCNKPVIKIESAPTVFLEFSGYEEIFLKKSICYLIGRQHGGGYGSHAVDLLFDYERKISDKFLGWGLSSDNLKQHKYERVNARISNHLRKVVWVERPRLPKYYCYLWQYFDECVIPYIYRELKKSDNVCMSLPYPGFARSDKYKGFRFNEINNQEYGESNIGLNDIAIFDTCSASLIYYCIENKIAYIIVISRKDMEYLSEKQTEWLNLLRKHGMAFYENEIDGLSSSINKILQQKEYVAHKEIIEFHSQVFNVIVDT